MSSFFVPLHQMYGSCGLSMALFGINCRLRLGFTWKCELWHEYLWYLCLLGTRSDPLTSRHTIVMCEWNCNGESAWGPFKEIIFVIMNEMHVTRCQTGKLARTFQNMPYRNAVSVQRFYSMRQETDVGASHQDSLDQRRPSFRDFVITCCNSDIASHSRRGMLTIRKKKKKSTNTTTLPCGREA